LVPYETHPLFNAPPDASAPLLRYIDLAKFISLLTTQSLFLSRSDLLGDEFEGSMTRMNLEMRSELFGGIPEDKWPLISRSRQMTRLWTYVNCWSGAPSESVAMWRLYVGDGNGLAIESTFDRLRDSIGGEKHVFVGTVKYADWDQRLIPESNLLAPFVYKRRGFSYEHEVRAVVQALPVNDSTEAVDWDAEPVAGINIPVSVPA
jgi:hypothetical protein